MTAWRTIEGARFYQVSRDGRVRSIDRQKQTRNGQVRKYRGKELSPTKNQYGHLKVPVRMDDGKTRQLYIHSLVAAAFIGRRPDGMEVAHDDGNPVNNEDRNLRYDTPKGNSADKKRHGTHRAGARHPGAKLSAEQVSAVREALGAGRLQKEIALEFGVCRATIGAIATGRSWR